MNAAIAGVLFIIGTVTGALAAAVIGPLLDAPNRLIQPADVSRHHAISKLRVDPGEIFGKPGRIQSPAHLKNTRKFMLLKKKALRQPYHKVLLGFQPP
jgi:hypothetical protein